MGYGLPAAIGASVGSAREFEGKKPVWLIDGDGSFQMTSEELATAFHDHTPVKIALLNNSVYGMVRQWQTLFYGEHYSATNLMDGENTPEIVDVPDFVKLAEAYGCIGMRAFTEEEVPPLFGGDQEGQRNQRSPGAYRLPRVEGRYGVADGRSWRFQRQCHLYARNQAAAAPEGRCRQRVNEQTSK